MALASASTYASTPASLSASAINVSVVSNTTDPCGACPEGRRRRLVALSPRASPSFLPSSARRRRVAVERRRRAPRARRCVALSVGRSFVRPTTPIFHSATRRDGASRRGRRGDDARVSSRAFARRVRATRARGRRGRDARKRTQRLDALDAALASAREGLDDARGALYAERISAVRSSGRGDVAATSGEVDGRRDADMWRRRRRRADG